MKKVPEIRELVCWAALSRLAAATRAPITIHDMPKEHFVDAETTMDRRWVILGAILIQLCLGAIYAWSVFTAPLKEAGWSVAQTQYVFTAGLVSFAIVMVLAGRLMPRSGPRRLAMAGGIVLGTGYVLASFQGGTQTCDQAFLVWEPAHPYGDGHDISQPDA